MTPAAFFFWEMAMRRFIGDVLSAAVVYLIVICAFLFLYIVAYFFCKTP